MEYTLILAISLLKSVDALVLQSAIYSIPGTAWQKIDILITTCFSFDDVSLKRDVKLVLIIFYSELGSFSFRRDIIWPLKFNLCILELSRFSQELHVKNPRLLKSTLKFIVCEA